MTNFTTIPGKAPAFAARAVCEVPGFAESQAYRLLDEELRLLPGLVFGALAQFVASAGEDEVRAAAALIEEAAMTDDNQLHESLACEVFEVWDDIEPGMRALIGRALGPQTRKLWRAWRELGWLYDDI